MFCKRFQSSSRSVYHARIFMIFFRGIRVDNINFLFSRNFSVFESDKAVTLALVFRLRCKHARRGEIFSYTHVSPAKNHSKRISSFEETKKKKHFSPSSHNVITRSYDFQSTPSTMHAHRVPCTMYNVCIAYVVLGSIIDAKNKRMNVSGEKKKISPNAVT